jgi:hypothetical protein
VRHAFSAEQPGAIGAPAHDGASFVRNPPGIARTLRDVLLIALAWALLIGVIIYPVAQIVGLITCAIALALSAARHGNAAA